MNSLELVGTHELALVMGCTPKTAWRVAKDNPGFSIKFGGRYAVPRAHVERVLAGETPEQIAASIYMRTPSTNGLLRSA